MGISFRSFFAIIRRLFDEGAIVWFNESLTFKERFKKDQQSRSYTFCLFL